MYHSNESPSSNVELLYEFIFISFGLHCVEGNDSEERTKKSEPFKSCIVLFTIVFPFLRLRMGETLKH